jgi:hypothetical protein
MTQRRMWAWLSLLLLFALPLAVWLQFSHQRTVADYDLKTLWTDPRQGDQRHVSELVAGRELVQDLDWSRLQERALERYGDASVCVGLYFANYFDRRNRGRLAASLEIAERVAEDTAPRWRERATATLDMASIRNYRFEPICFDDLTLAEAAAQSGRLRLRGVDGAPGSSVTVYLARYEQPLAAVELDGEADALSLIHRLQVRADHGAERRAARLVMVYVLAVLLLVAFAVAPTLRARERTRPGGLMG